MCKDTLGILFIWQDWPIFVTVTFTVSWPWLYIPRVLALRGWRQKDAELEASLGYIAH